MNMYICPRHMITTIQSSWLVRLFEEDINTNIQSVAMDSLIVGGGRVCFSANDGVPLVNFRVSNQY
jgi:hypothetical protein